MSTLINFFFRIAQVEWAKVFVLILLCSSTLFVNLGGWDLWTPDEPRYAEVAKEMVRTGNYLVPHLGAEVYPKKPPLLFWIIAVLSKPLGEVTATSARLPSALAALGIILLTYLLGQMLYNSSTGIMAGYILLTANEFFRFAHRVNIDMTLTLWTTLAFFLFYCGYSKKNHQQRYYLSSYLFMGLGVLTKGPIAFLVPMISISLFLIVRGEYKKFREIAIVRGSFIVLVVVSLWLIPACVLGGGDYTLNILIRQNFGIIVHSFSHRAPFYFYLIHFPKDFLPWTFFIPSAVLYFWEIKKRGETADIQFPLLWFVGPFIFLSLISSKRNIYLLPLYPAAALIIARFWYGCADTMRQKVCKMQLKKLQMPCILFFIGIVIFGLYAILAVACKFKFEKFMQAGGASVYPVAILLCGAGLIGLTLSRRSKNTMVLFALITAIMLGMFYFCIFKIFPSRDASKSPRPFIQRIESIVKPEDALCYFLIDQSLFYYFKRDPSPEIKSYSQLQETLNAHDTIYCVLLKKEYEMAPQEIKSMVTKVEQGKFGKATYYLIKKIPYDK